MSCARAEPSGHSLLFIQILLGNIILGYFVRPNSLFILIPGILHACHCLGLESVTFFK